MTHSDTVSGTLIANGVEHTIKCTFGRDDCTVEAQNIRTAEHWKGAFNADFIEETTKKTGNFKQFSVFCEMLADAIQAISDSVELELLTLSDLMELKTGKRSTKQSSDNKRYLILTYKVQYDTVHYPLALAYTGKMNTVQLQANVTKLQKEIEKLKDQIVTCTTEQSRERSYVASPSHPECCRENAALREELAILRDRDRTAAKASMNSQNSKQLKLLQNSLKNLEGDMIREKNKYQRTLDKKNIECRKLVDEVEKLRIENRSLTVKLRSLTTEVNISKREKLARMSSYSDRSTSRSRPRSAPLRSSREPIAKRAESRSVSRGRTSSLGTNNSKRSNSRGSNVSGGSRRSQSPGQFPRFDPSAYVREKQAKLKQKQRERERQQRANTYFPRSRSTPLSRGSSRDRSRDPSPIPSPALSSSIYHKPPTSSVVKNIIKDNLINGRSGRTYSASSTDSAQSTSLQPKKKRYSYVSEDSDYDVGKENRKPQNRKSIPRRSRYINVTPDKSMNTSSMSYTKDSDIADIDARLNALQSYLKDAKNRKF